MRNLIKILYLTLLILHCNQSLAQTQNSTDIADHSDVDGEVEEIKEDESRLYNTAIIQGLNKTTAKTSILEMKMEDVIKFGQIQIIAHKCWQSPLDQKPESKILVEVMENKEGKSSRIFYGWMFASSPSISGLEHPIYDLTAISCKNK